MLQFFDKNIRDFRYYFYNYYNILRLLFYRLINALCVHATYQHRISNFRQFQRGAWDTRINLNRIYPLLKTKGWRIFRLGSMFGMIFRVAFTFRVASSEYFIGETRSRNWCGKSVRMIKIGETAGSRIEEEDFYLEFPDSFRGISIVNIREEYLREREVPPLTFPWIFVRLLRKKKNRNPDIFHSVHSYYKLKIEYIYIYTYIMPFAIASRETN